MLTCVSDDFRLLIGCLGTEPSLFRMPVTEARFIDFEKRRQEMEQFERTIKAHAKDTKLAASPSLQLTVSVELASASVSAGLVRSPQTAQEGFEGAPSAAVRVEVQAAAAAVDVSFRSEAFCSQAHFCLRAPFPQTVSIAVFARDRPVQDSRYVVTGVSASGGRCPPVTKSWLGLKSSSPSGRCVSCSLISRGCCKVPSPRP